MAISISSLTWANTLRLVAIKTNGLTSKVRLLRAYFLIFMPPYTIIKFR